VAVYRRTTRSRFILLVVTLLSLTIITLDQRGTGDGVLGKVRNGVHDALAPVQSGVSTVVSPVGDFFNGVVHYGDLKEENARLREQLAEQRAVVEQAVNTQRENKELTDQENLPFVGNIPAVTARVVATSPSNFEQVLTIDKGTADGVAEGMPVVSGQGLVGRVGDSSRHRATIVLITDTDSSVGVRLATSRDIGVASGKGAGQPLTVDLISPESKIPTRDTVVTEQGTFPPNIPVGRVRAAHTRPGALKQDVTIDPIVDLRRITFVKVLQWSTP
jgi:rod shape-determining protein MreC